MVDRPLLSLAVVGSTSAPTCPLDVLLRTSGDAVIVERDMAEGVKLLLLARPVDVRRRTGDALPYPTHRKRKSSSTERKGAVTAGGGRSSLSAAASVSSSSSSSSGGGLQSGSTPRTAPPTSNAAVAHVRPAARSRMRPHRRSLSTSDHAHFAGTKQVPTLTPAAFEAGDDDDSVVEHSVHDDEGEDEGYAEGSNTSSNSSSSSSSSSSDSDNDDDDDDDDRAPPPTNNSLPPPPHKHATKQKGPLGRVADTDSSGPPSPDSAARRVGGNSPMYRPRRSSAPDLDPIVESQEPASASSPAVPHPASAMQPTKRALDPINTALPSSASSRGGGMTRTSALRAEASAEDEPPSTSSKASSASSVTSSRRRHKRQLSAPVIVGGGADVDANANAPELKLSEGLFITRTGISATATGTPGSAHSFRTNASSSMFSSSSAHNNNNPSASPPNRRIIAADDDVGYKVEREDEEAGVGNPHHHHHQTVRSPTAAAAAAALTARGGDDTDSLGTSSSVNTTRMPLTPSLFNADELETIGFLGKGTAGVVTKALHVTALRIVAVKAVHVFDATRQESTAAEIRALHKRMIPFAKDADFEQEDSSCIVGFFDAFLPPGKGTVNLVLEYMDGGSLQDLIDAKQAQKSSLPEDFISVACRRMLHGLCELHKERLLHRDLKPANVLVSRSGAVKLSDFGVSIAFGLGSLSKAQTFVGSLSYMAPERVQGAGGENSSGGYSYAADLWGVGLIAYVCATGEYPFAKQFDESGFWGMVQAVNDDVPQLDAKRYTPEFVDFVGMCLKRDPAERPTALELLQHPFVCRIRDVKLANKAIADQLRAVDPTAARAELLRLLTIAADYHVRKAMKYQHTLPRFSAHRVRGLAMQIGLPFADVNDPDLEQIVDQVNAKLLTSSSSLLSSSPAALAAAAQYSPNSQDSSSNVSATSPSSGANNNIPLWKKGNLKLELDRTW